MLAFGSRGTSAPIAPMHSDSSDSSDPSDPSVLQRTLRPSVPTGRRGGGCSNDLRDLNAQLCTTLLVSAIFRTFVPNNRIFR